MFIALRKRLEDREEGFTLIELLVVVIIIGILAAIAIPTFLNQRERARRGAVQSDLRNISVQAETFFTDNGTYAGFATSPLFTEYRRSDGVTLTVASADANQFCVNGVHAGLPAGETWSFDSNSLRGTVAGPQLDDVPC